MEHYDLIVIGTGAGQNVASQAYSQGMKVAVIDKDPIGGTCLNRGCIPSKVWTTVADYIREAEDAAAAGVHMKVESTDYPLIRKRTWEIIMESRVAMERGVGAAPNFDFYNDVAEFVDDMTLQVGKKRITAPRIIIASGAKPYIPPIEDIEKVGYLTNRNIFDLERLPRSIIIVGGGYIATEFGHFLSAMGVETTIVGRNPRLLKREDPEVSAAVLAGMARRMRVLVNFEAVSASKDKDGKSMVIRDRGTGKTYKLDAEEILIAAGRVSNADMLKPWVTGVEVDDEGWIKTDDMLRTTREDVWAMGDCVNRGQFRHTANYHSDVVWRNAFEGSKVKVDEHAIPSAVFTWPQVGSVGLTEEAATAAGYHVHVGKYFFYDSAKGFALGDKEAFSKVVVDASNNKILGAHIVGPQASVLVQLVVDLMNAGDETFYPLARAQVIHPALSEVVIRAFASLTHPGGHGHGDHGHGHGHDHGDGHGHGGHEAQGHEGPKRERRRARTQGHGHYHGHGHDDGHDHSH
ncbi:MAG: dihydrolipoyl dehydrogenase [Thermoplasmata archaeon]|nr:MAG: dihydrolipoyl dehydrogenase [Thermoplasmata archaeon]